MITRGERKGGQKGAVIAAKAIAAVVLLMIMAAAAVVLDILAVVGMVVVMAAGQSEHASIVALLALLLGLSSFGMYRFCRQSRSGSGSNDTLSLIVLADMPDRSDDTLVNPATQLPLELPPSAWCFRWLFGQTCNRASMISSYK